MNKKLLISLIAGGVAVVIAIATGLIIFFTGRNDEIAPVSITVAPNTMQTFIDTEYPISFAVYPQDATNTSVNITSSDNSVVSVEETFIDSANDSVVVSAVGIGEATITFQINGTNIKTVHSVRVYDNPTPLTVPADLQYNDLTGNITFSSVGHADKYHLNVNGNIVEVAEPQPNNLSTHIITYNAFGENGGLTPGVEYSVMVRAVGDGLFYSSSTYGDYEQTPLEILKLSAPTNVVANQNTVTWDHNANYLAEPIPVPEGEEGEPTTNYVGYIVTVDDVDQPVQTENSFDVAISDAGTYQVSVRAVVIDDTKTTIYDSATSDIASIVKLTEASNLLVSNDEIDNELYEDALFRWDAVTGAGGYTVTVSPALLDGTTTYNIDANQSREIIIDEQYAEGTTYTFSIVAVGADASVIASGTSTYSFTKLQTVTNTRMTGEVLYFDVLNITAQVEYEVVLTYNNTTTTYIVLGGSLDLDGITNQAGEYSVKIRSLAFHDEQSEEQYANSKLLETELTFVKLASPVISKITNNSEIYWGLVPSATVYDVYFDNQYVVSLAADSLTTDGAETNEQGIFNLSSMATITAGAHTVSIVALGTGAENIINSAAEDKVVYSFSKLAKPTNFSVSADVISWDAIAGIYYYAVGENTQTLTTIGGVNSYSLQAPLEQNTIYVIAGGNNKNMISSDVSSFMINKLLSPANVRTENGVLYFDYSEDNYYKLYVNDLDLGIVVQNGTYAFNTNLSIGQNSEVAVKAFPKEDIEGYTYLSSDKTYVQLTKLASPTNLVNSKIEGTENYTLSWDAVAGAVNYRIIITPVSAGDTSEMTLNVLQSTTSYNIPANWVKGLFAVQVYAVGNSTSLMNNQLGSITSQISAEYDIVKLAAPTNVRVSNGKVVWTASNNPNSAVPDEYELKVIYDDTTTYYTTQSTSYAIDTPSGNYTIEVRAIGPQTQNMTSIWSVSNVFSKLAIVQNIRVTTSGILAWDDYNTTYGTGLSVVYDLYLTPYETGVRQLLVSDYTQTNYVITEGISVNQDHIFEIVVRAADYLDSDFSDPFTFQKLDVVQDFAIANSTFSWTQQPSALGYEILNVTNGQNSVYALLDNATFTAPFNEGETLESGTYTFKIRAIGGDDGVTNFINSDYSTVVTVTILSNVSSMNVSEGVLNWNLSYSDGEEYDLPVRYDIYIYEILDGGGYSSAVVHSVSNTVTEYDLSGLNSGDYKIEIVSVGNSTNKIDSNPAVLELVSKPNATSIALRAENGVLMWDAFVGTGVSYELYLDGTSLETITETTYVPTGLTPLQQYNFKILVHADGYLTSAFSNELTIVKLPQVQNFAINQNVEGQPHYFSWSLVENASVEIAEGYEVVPTETLAQFSGGANKGESTLNFTVSTAGTYEFQIIAVGSTNNSGITYLTSDVANVVTVVVLDKVTNVAIQNNALTYTASDLFVDANTTPDSFLIEVYSLDGEGAETLEASKTMTNVYSWDMKVDGTLLPEGTYNIRIYSVGTQNFKVTSAAASLQNVVILAAPTDLRVNTGLVDFALSSAEGIVVSYEVWLNGSLLVTITDNSEAQVQLINDAITTTSTEQTLKIRAVASDAIYSVYSADLTVSKLASVGGIQIALNNNISTIYWSNVTNAASYRMMMSPYVTEFDTLPYYNTERAWFALTMSGTEGYALPTNLPANTYDYYFVAVGNTTVANSGSVGYLTSNASDSSSFVVMEAPSGLRLETGLVKWNATTGAVRYLLEFYATDTVDENTPVFKTVNTNALQYDINTSEFVPGTYTMFIYALGDGVQYISSTSYEEIVLIRNTAPTDFKILNGLLSWTVSTNDILLATTRETTATLTGEDLVLLTQIFEGTEDGISTALLKNLYGLFHMELTINGVKYSIVPSQVAYDTDVFTMYYSVDLPAGSYTMSMRGVGNTPANGSGEGSTLSVIDSEMLDVVYNYTYTIKTAELTAYKLASPVTPVYPQTTSIVDNRFYWAPVTNNLNETILNYYIIAQAKGGTTSDVIDLITIDAGDNSPSVDIRDLVDETTLAIIPAGFLYNISVIAQGTLDSDLNAGTNYLNSSYTNVSEVQILNEPNSLKVLDGQISFATNLNATTHLLHVWNNGGDYDAAVSDTQNDLIKREIEINLTTVESDTNLTFVDGIYYYNLEDNALFPATDNAYKASVLAVGNGVDVISAYETTVITVAKWNSVELEGAYDITIESGMFKWTNVSFVNPITLNTEYPENYKVTIIRSSAVDETVQTTLIYNTAQTTDAFIYFELPDTDAYPATILVDDVTYDYTYQIVVSALGDESGTSGGLQFATGNSTTSKTGTRLETPINLTTVLGQIQWNAVENAAGYDIYISEIYLNDYETTSLGNVIEFSLNSSFESGTYTIKVRANSNSVNYLNSRQSSEMRAVKLDTPNLRVESGVIKWNNTDLPFALTTYTLFEIEGPAGFVGADLVGYEESDFEVTNDVYATNIAYDDVSNTTVGFDLSGTLQGDYTIGVTYVGSNGSVTSGEDAYYLVTSDKIEFTFTKLPAPVIDSTSEEDENGAQNYIIWDEISFATDYNVVVYDIDDQTQEVTNQIVLNYKNNASYFTTADGSVKFNLQAVSDYDDNNPDLEAFGDEYRVYVQAFGDNSFATSLETRFSMSNDSNIEIIAIPLRPTNLQLDEYGTITWTNNSDAKPVLELSYLDNGEYTTPELIELPLGTTSYVLTQISSDYQIRIKAIIGTLQEGGGGIISQSAFTDVVSGAFNLFESGDGSVTTPYNITNAQHLFNINYYPSANYEVLNDLDTSIYSELSEWKPIGVADAGLMIEQSQFMGVLNGNGYTVNTITFTNTVATELGFIHTIGSTGQVTDLVLNVSATSVSAASFGALAVYNYGTVSGVTISGGVHLLNNRIDTFAAGVVTYNMSGATIDNTINNATLTSNTNNATNTNSVGGIVYQNQGTVTAVGNNGAITATSVGGVVYMNQNVVTQSYNKGALVAVANADYQRDIYVGGLVAVNESTATISSSYVRAYETIVVTNNSNYIAYVGGLIGSNGSTGMITNSYSVYKLGATVGSGVVQSGAIAGNSTNYTSNFDNIYYQDIGTTLYALGNRANSVTGISMYTEIQMKQPSFATTLVNYFVAVTNSYPELTWES